MLAKEIQALFDKAMSFTPSKEVDHTMPVYLGVDWGGGVNAFTVVWIWQLVNDALPRFKLLNVRKFDQPEDRSTEVQADKVIELMDKFEVDQAVMDAGGGTRQVEKLSNRYGPRMVKCTFITRPEDPFELISSENRVNVDRTWGIETIIDLITRPETRADYPNPIPRIFIPASDLEKVEWIIDHFTCIEAESIQLSSGRNYVRYTHPEETNDDALMACLYAYMAHLVKKGSEWRWIRG